MLSQLLAGRTTPPLAFGEGALLNLGGESLRFAQGGGTLRSPPLLQPEISVRSALPNLGLCPKTPAQRGAPPPPFGNPPSRNCRAFGATAALRSASLTSFAPLNFVLSTQLPQLRCNSRASLNWVLLCSLRYAPLNWVLLSSSNINIYSIFDK